MIKWWKKYPDKEKRVLLYFAFIFCYLIIYSIREFMGYGSHWSFKFVYASILIFSALVSYGFLLHTDKCVDTALENQHLWIFKSLIPKVLYRRKNYRIFVVLTGWIFLILAVIGIFNLIMDFVKFIVYL